MLSSMMEVADLTRQELRHLTGKTDAQIGRWLRDFDAVPVYVKTLVEAWAFVSKAGKEHLLDGMKVKQTAGKGRSSYAEIDGNIEDIVRVAKKVLRENPDKSYSRTALAEAIAVTGEVGVKAQQIYKRYMMSIYAEIGDKYLTGDGGRFDRFQYKR